MAGPEQLRKGALVRLSGLVSRPELNGCEGEVLSGEQGERYPVKVRSGSSEERILVKLKNCVLAPAHAAAAPSAAPASAPNEGSSSLKAELNSRGGSEAARDPGPRLRQDVSVIEQLMTRRKGLLERMRRAELSLKDISEHQMFLSVLETDLLQQRTELERKHRITEAMLKKATPSASVALEHKMDALRRWEVAFNEKVHLLQKERAWFHRQPAFEQARAHVMERFKEDAHGNYYNPDELAAETEELFGKSFEQILQEEKDDLAAVGGSFEDALREARAEMETGGGESGSPEKKDSSGRGSKARGKTGKKSSQPT